MESERAGKIDTERERERERESERERARFNIERETGRERERERETDTAKITGKCTTCSLVFESERRLDKFP